MKKTIGTNLTMNEIYYMDEIGPYEFHHMNEIDNVGDINDMDTIGTKDEILTYGWDGQHR